MAEQTALVHGLGQSCMVAGLSWQLLSKTGRRQQIAEIRTLANAIEARQYVARTANDLNYVGFYNYDAFVADEGRPRKAYSLAAFLCRQFGEQDTIVLWNIEQGQRKDDVCLVVIEKGVPITDLVLSRQEAQSTAESYLSDAFREQGYRLLSNDTSSFPAAEMIAPDVLKLSFFRQDAIVNLPVDPAKLLMVLLLVTFLAAALYAGNEYRTYLEQQALLEEMQNADKRPAYKAKLSETQRSLGMTSQDTFKVMNTLLGQSFVRDGWVLKEMSCRLGACTGMWNSEGGYTQEIIKTMGTRKPQIDIKNFKSIRFELDIPVAVDGVESLNELPSKKTLVDTLYDEQQIWSKANVQYQLSLDGQVWPSGFENIPEGDAMKRYALKVTGDSATVEYFLTQYKHAVYWDSIKLNLNAFDIKNAVTFELQGAFYAY
ncbi:MAG: type 4b pilus protein PilO2 [Burkholderiales bacterium]|jgi:hypothetical protein|nr:type 4b pilus protein PilO2 [Burkholderiales bacterium]